MNPAAALNSMSSITSSAADVHAKALKAGEQFEAILLNMVLGGVERSFTQLPGSKIGQETEAYSGLGMQALTSGLAHAGGIGIAATIAKSLQKTEVPTKV